MLTIYSNIATTNQESDNEPRFDMEGAAQEQKSSSCVKTPSP